MFLFEYFTRYALLDEDILIGPELYPSQPVKNHRKHRKGRIVSSAVQKKKLLYTTSGSTATRRLKRKQYKIKVANLRKKKHFCKYCLKFVCKKGKRNVRIHQKKCEPWLKHEKRRVAARARYARKKAMKH